VEFWQFLFLIYKEACTYNLMSHQTKPGRLFCLVQSPHQAGGRATQFRAVPRPPAAAEAAGEWRRVCHSAVYDRDTASSALRRSRSMTGWVTSFSNYTGQSTPNAEKSAGLNDFQMFVLPEAARQQRFQVNRSVDLSTPYAASQPNAAPTHQIAATAHPGILLLIFPESPAS